MTHPTFSTLRFLSRALFAIAIASGVAACRDSTNTDSSDRAPPAAEPAQVAHAVQDAAETATASHPLCDLASFVEVSAVAGGNFNKLDVIEADGMNSLDCVYLDMSDLTNGLSIRFFTKEKLLATSSKWRSASAYFEEWGRGGTDAAGIGTRAVWTDVLGGLLVLQGDHVILLSGAKIDAADPAGRGKLESLAQQVVGRLPKVAER